MFPVCAYDMRRTFGDRFNVLLNSKTSTVLVTDPSAPHGVVHTLSVHVIFYSCECSHLYTFSPHIYRITLFSSSAYIFGSGCMLFCPSIYTTTFTSHWSFSFQRCLTKKLLHVSLSYCRARKTFKNISGKK